MGKVTINLGTSILDLVEYSFEYSSVCFCCYVTLHMPYNKDEGKYTALRY